MTRPTIATVSLAGCFGCHMSLLDLDLRILDIVERVEFARSPFNDLKEFEGRCRIGFVEGGCANEENVRVLREFREHCDILLSVGDCATMGGLPALRNGIPLLECLSEAYLDGPSVVNPERGIPDDPELPLLLDRVYPCHEVVKVELFLPGCPPSADAILEVLLALLADEPVELSWENLKSD